MSRLLAIVIVLATCAAAEANVGVFTGSGYTIKLVQSADVQMVSEDVTIVPGRGRFLSDGTVPGMNRVEYQCKFVLKNRSAKAVTIQAGFPLDSEFYSHSTPIKADEADIVLEYKFIARDHDKTYHVRFVPHDADKHLAAIFLWDMEFQPGESRELRVGYEMPISMSLASGAKARDQREYARHWYQSLESGFIEQFSYVTETGKSWAGEVEKAEIHVYVGGFEKYLSARRVVEQPEGADNDAENKRHLDPVLNSYYKDWLLHRQIEPKGWTEKDGTVTWQFKGRVPDGPITVSYLLVYVPQSVQAVHLVVEALARKPAAEAKGEDPFGGAAAKEANELGPANLPDNLADLREVLLASWGIAPTREPVRAFVANQVWYSPDKSATEKGLSSQRQRILSELDQLAAKAHR